MESHCSRRTFIKQGVAAFGAIIVADLAIQGTAAAASTPTTLTAQALEKSPMPHITVKLYPGRSEDEKKQLAAKIVQDVVSTLNISEASVSVAIEEVAPSDWPEKVYRQEIMDNEKNLYKKPGYNPFK